MMVIIIQAIDVIYLVRVGMQLRILLNYNLCVYSNVVHIHVGMLSLRGLNSYLLYSFLQSVTALFHEQRLFFKESQCPAKRAGQFR